MAKGTRRKRTKSNAGPTELEAYVTFPGVDHLEGEIIKHSKDNVEFSYMRYGSRYRQVIPAQQIIACYGTLGSKECHVWYRTDAQTLFTTGKRDRGIGIDNPTPYGEHLIRGASSDAGIILLNPNCIRMVSKTTEGNRGRRKGSGKSEGKSEGKSKDKEKTADKGEKRERRRAASGGAAASWPA